MSSNLAEPNQSQWRHRMQFLSLNPGFRAAEHFFVFDSSSACNRNFLEKKFVFLLFWILQHFFRKKFLFYASVFKNFHIGVSLSFVLRDFTCSNINIDTVIDIDNNTDRNLVTRDHLFIFIDFKRKNGNRNLLRARSFQIDYDIQYSLEQNQRQYPEYKKVFRLKR